MVGLVRQVLVAASEFGGELFHMANSDVEQAFDQMRQEDQVRALRARGATHEEAWLIARDLVGSVVVLEVPEFLGRTFRSRCPWQGVGFKEEFSHPILGTT